MRRVRAFFQWWFRELRGLVSAGNTAPLALTFGDREIALVERGDTAPLSVVQIDEPDAAQRIEALRATAERRAAGQASVDLRLPDDQVRFIDVLPGDGDLEQRAALQLSREAEDLVVVPVARQRKGRPVPVAVTLRSTVSEAVALARKWGFEPVRVTTHEVPERMSDTPAFFTGGVALRSPFINRAILATGCAAVVFCGFAVYRLIEAREGLAERLTEQAEAIRPLGFDTDEQAIALANFADAASMGVETRASNPPVWSLLGALTRALPPDLAIDSVRYSNGRLELSGTGLSVERFVAALEADAAFDAPTVAKEKAGRSAIRFSVIVPLTGQGPS